MTQPAALLTTAEVAAQLRVHPGTVRRWVVKRELQPAAITPGGQYRFSPESLADMAAKPAIEREAS